MSVKRVNPTGVSYEGTTTLNEKTPTEADVQELAEKVEAVQRLVEKRPELVAVTPLETRTTNIGDKWYELKKGEPIAVPPHVRDILANCKVI